MANPTETPKTYTIKPGDCLSLLAEHFGTKPEILAKLNSDLIDDIDLIYAGDTIILPGEDANSAIDNQPGSRDEIPKPPEKDACAGDLCSGKDTPFTDILYVPSHPTEKQKRFYAITDEVKQAIQAEHKRLAKSIVADQTETIQNLNRLGILSRFYTSPHEMFLESEDDLKRYRFLFHARKTIRSGAAKNYQNGGENGFIVSLAEQEGFDTNKLLDRYTTWEKLKYWTFIGVMWTSPIARTLLLTSNNVKDYLKEASKEAYHLKQARKQLKETLQDHLDDEIEKLDKVAELTAKNKNADDGSSYVYDKKRSYFTSNYEKEIENSVKMLLRERKMWGTDAKLALDSHEQATQLIENLWDREVKYADEFIKKCTAAREAHEDERLVTVGPYSYNNLPYAWNFTRTLNALNLRGYVVKEQCLTMAELEGTSPAHLGPKTLEKNFSEWRENKFFTDNGLPVKITEGAKLVNDLLTELKVNKEALHATNIDGTRKQTEEELIKSLLSQGCAGQWAYYPCLALVKLVDATITKWIADLDELLGLDKDEQNKRMPAPDMFGDFLWLKKLAMARIDALKTIATSRAQKGPDSLRNFYLSGDKIPTSYLLLWEEKEYRPKEKKTKVFHKETGKADLQVVECVLMSEGTLGWVRGPAWYLPKDEKDTLLAKGHLSDITTKVALVSPAADSKTPQNIKTAQANAFPTLSEAMKAIRTSIKTDSVKALKASMLNGKFLLNPINLAAEKKSEVSAFWSDSYHWEEGLGPDGKSSQYVVDASAQFMRLSSSVKTNLNLPLSEYNNLAVNTDTTAGGALNFTADLFRAQLTAKAWFPLQPENDDHKDKRQFKGKPLAIHYLKNVDGQDKKDIYDAGEMFMRVSATIYGLAAASVSIAGNLCFGPATTKAGELGVRGKAITTADYNAGEISHVRAAPPAPLPQSEQSVGQRALGTLKKNSAAQAGITVDAFAGVEVGGELSGEVYWRPPTIDISNSAERGKMMRLGSLAVQAAVSYGVGLSAQFSITFHRGALYVIVAAKLVCGPGASGKVAIALDALNVDRFIQCLLAMLNESGFKRIEAFGEVDEQGRNEDFEELNRYLTAAVALGLTLGEILLLLAKALSFIHKDGLQEDYAPLIARRIIKKDEGKEGKKKIQMWVSDLPPETLCNLLDCLSNQNKGGLFENDEEKVARQNQEVDKALAIVQILEWISPKTGASEADIEKKRRQFEKTLIRMGGNYESARLPMEQWRRFTQSWMQLAKFINQTLTFLAPTATEYVRIRNGFQSQSIILCSNMKRYHYEAEEHSDAMAHLLDGEYDYLTIRVAKEGDKPQVVADRKRLEETIQAIEDKGYLWNKTTYKPWKEKSWTL
ncbi:LysM peptidoglycan-binding domain-containing protein [Vibrio rhizosphaerae]|uniref:LysM peptidoglycan-binding domain-containing protein n=1 Tax=Vibrio rhizosphaerae TaxID=398736 RepID=UPI00056FB901|nr:LysM domain-containing protein [Vibrio rhizosphaerae]